MYTGLPRGSPQSQARAHARHAAASQGPAPPGRARLFPFAKTRPARPVPLGLIPCGSHGGASPVGGGGVAKLTGRTAVRVLPGRPGTREGKVAAVRQRPTRAACCKTMDCVEVCPVDCLYEGENIPLVTISVALAASKTMARWTCFAYNVSMVLSPRLHATARRPQATSQGGGGR
jgi:NAD-dependent dihydropyrimidine dehydrogenase PreA subunit